MILWFATPSWIGFGKDNGGVAIGVCGNEAFVGTLTFSVYVEGIGFAGGYVC